MPRSLRDVTQEEAIRAFVRAGWTEARRRGRGSHRILIREGIVPLVVPSGILKIGVLKSLIKRAGLTEEEFQELL